LAADVGRRELSADGDGTDTEAEEADRVATDPSIGRTRGTRRRAADDTTAEVPPAGVQRDHGGDQEPVRPERDTEGATGDQPDAEPGRSALFTVRIVTRMIKTCTSPSVVAGAGHRRFPPSATRVTSA